MNHHQHSTIEHQHRRRLRRRRIASLTSHTGLWVGAAAVALAVGLLVVALAAPPARASSGKCTVRPDTVRCQAVHPADATVPMSVGAVGAPLLAALAAAGFAIGGSLRTRRTRGRRDGGWGRRASAPAATRPAVGAPRS